ncbi:unnamed protein product [Pleuronectes platessa]|uniref:Uncharacterized protein n=1 Tax=Pleuronectes platessa TaxID=8262 RepID=A0A9N7Y9F8_PLEPL|nr:unnamed protein product [Pleuronectes platessa]
MRTCAHRVADCPVFTGRRRAALWVLAVLRARGVSLRMQNETSANENSSERLNSGRNEEKKRSKARDHLEDNSAQIRCCPTRPRRLSKSRRVFCARAPVCSRGHV